MVTVQLLGGACLRAGDTPLTGPPAQRHRVALLTLTVAAWPQPVARDRAMALLWPEKDTASARRLLNLAVHVLRSALGESTIASAGDALVFNPACVRCDLHELRAAIAAADDPARIVRAHTGVLLDGFHLDDSPEFGYWLDERRSEIAHAYAGALLAVADAQERAGDVHGRVGTCRRLVAADPYSGPYAQRLMRALDAAGDRTSAIRHAHDHARRLREELDLEPDDGVVALARALRDRARVHAAPTPDVRAYQLFQQGREHHIRYTIASVMRGMEYFERAIAIDPGFALAHAYLAMAYTELMEMGGVAHDVARRRAMESARRALALAPELSEAHCTMGYVLALHELDWGGAEREFRRAIELRPGDAAAYDLYGRLCAGIGRYDEAIALLERAQALDPLAHRLDLATALMRAGRHGEAVQRAEDAVAFDPAHDRTRATLGWAYFNAGRRAEGIAQLERAVALAPENTMWLAQLAQAAAMAGDRARALAILADLEARAATGYVSPYNLVYVHTGLGDVERALDYLERAVAERAGPAYGIKGSFLLAPLRGNPRFQALLRAMKLA